MIPEATMTFIVGPGGESKSTLTTHLAALLSRGELPGDYAGHPTPVLLINSEDDPEVTILPNLLVAGADMKLIHSRDDLVLPDHLDELLIACEVTGARVVILDPLIPQFSGSLTSYAGVQKRLKPVILACARRGITLIAVHHTTKEIKKPTVNAMLGSVGLSTVARQVLFVGHRGDAKIIGVVKSNVGMVDHGWVYDVNRVPIEAESPITGGQVTFIRRAMKTEIELMYAKKAAFGDDARLTTLLVYVRKYGRVTSTEAREYLEHQERIRRRTAVQAISDAVGIGLLKRIGSSSTVHSLELTDDGHDFVADVAVLEEEPEGPAAVS
jgi:hypothetical protein